MVTATLGSTLRRRGGDRLLTVVGGLLVAAGLAVGVVRAGLGSAPAERAMEGPWGALALASVVSAPGVLVLLARRERPQLLLPAAVVLVPLSLMSFVLLPLLVVAAVLVVAHRRRRAGGCAALANALPCLGVVALLEAAFVALFVHDDSRQYATPHRSGSTSDVITALEALVSLGLVVTAIGVGWLASGRRR